jgi:ABC-type Fe3+ transport system substrate-binding protein
MAQTRYLRYWSVVRPVVFFVMSALFGFAALSGCGKNPSGAGQETTLVVMTPHNENIRYEFEEAFKEYCKTTYGTDVTVQWRDAGSGSSSILQYLTNVYSRTETSGIDVLFGGGEYPFQQMDKAGLLVPLKFTEDTLANIPATFGGMEMYSPDKTWCGNVLSSFGFLYNKELITQLGIQPPKQWEDLASKEFYDLSVLADPTQSGSIAAAFEMIVQSEKEWHQGWKKLLSILSNAKKFTDSSGDAANAPVLGEAVVSVCIDFYGSMRVADAPDKLGYVSPTGQTGFTPDPIAILKNPPNPVLAQRYVDFVLSLQGQAIWALPPGHPNGPKRYLLNRTPIRSDFFAKYDKDIPAWITRPYAEGTTLVVDAKLRAIRYGVLAKLVRAAAIDNIKLMKRAKLKLMEKNFPDDLSALFYELPANIDTTEEVFTIAEPLEDTAKAEVIMTDWTTFFRERYKQIIEK